MVGPVDHGDLDVLEAQGAHPVMIEQSSWARDDNVDTTAQRTDLSAGSHASVDGRGPKSNLGRDGPQGGVDFIGELASRSQDDGAR